MDFSEEELTRWIDGLRLGDDRVLLDFWNRFGPALEQLAQRRMEPGLRRRIGPEDVAQSVCRTFFRRMHGGEFQFGEDNSGLWRLLCAITLAKVREKARYHLRLKRGLQREASLDSPSGGDFVHVDPGPTPAESAEFADGLEHVLSELDDEERRIVELRLEEKTQTEIAAEMGCAERTVRRILQRVQAKFDQALSSI
jgi:RNA polymerase sigma factor (sigma-70 family)